MLFIVIGLILLYKGFEDRVFLYSFIATSLFLAGILVSANIPFSVNASGEVIGVASNLALIGINLLFGLIALLVSILNAYDLFGSWKK